MNKIKKLVKNLTNVIYHTVIYSSLPPKYEWDLNWGNLMKMMQKYVNASYTVSKIPLSNDTDSYKWVGAVCVKNTSPSVGETT